MNLKKIGMFSLGFFGTALFIIPGMMLAGVHPALIIVYIAAEVALLVFAIRAYRRKVWDEWLTIGIIIAGTAKVGFMVTLGWCISMVANNY